jgi:hypothetical protein
VGVKATVKAAAEATKEEAANTRPNASERNFILLSDQGLGKEQFHYQINNNITLSIASYKIAINK